MRPTRPASAVRPGQLARRVENRERKQHERCGEHVPRCEDGSGDVADLQLPVDAARRVREGREDDRERPGDRPPAAARVEAGERCHAEEPERDTRDANGSHVLVWEEARREQEREDRHRRLRDARDARVDVGLAPGDEPHRDRGVDDAEHDARQPGGAELGDRACAPRRQAR